MRKYKVNENYFDVLNENSSYWLGFLYADGYVRMKDGKSGELKLKLKDTDKEHICKFLNDIESNHPIKCGTDNKSNFCQVSVNSTIMVKRLFELGCDNKKTFKIRLPELPLNLMNHFIRGYFDGDGSVSKVKNRPNSFNVSICSNKTFNKDVINFLGYGKIYEDKNFSVIKIHKIDDIKKFRDFIYNGAQVLMKRKLEVFNKINDNFKRNYSTNKNRKKYKLTNPNGLIIITDNLKLSCTDNDLNYSTMSNLSRGIGNTNKGWKCEVLN
jgi:hypothetical protein